MRTARIQKVMATWQRKPQPWQDQAVSAYRQIGGSDEAYATEFRVQHETYTKHRIIHEQSAAAIRALAGEPS